VEGLFSMISRSQTGGAVFRSFLIGEQIFFVGGGGGILNWSGLLPL
jgi:hypothetical protein